MAYGKPIPKLLQSSSTKDEINMKIIESLRDENGFIETSLKFNRTKIFENDFKTNTKKLQQSNEHFPKDMLKIDLYIIVKS